MHNHHWPESLPQAYKVVHQKNYFGPFTSKSVAVSISIFSTARSWFISVTDCIASASACRSQRNKHNVHAENPTSLNVTKITHKLSCHYSNDGSKCSCPEIPHIHASRRIWRRCSTDVKNVIHIGLRFYSKNNCKRRADATTYNLGGMYSSDSWRATLTI